jgi:phage gp36-like protein
LAYVTQAEIESALGGAAALKRVMRATEIDTASLGESIAAADALIDSYAAGSAGYPWTTVPEQVTQLALDLSVYYLYLRHWSQTEVPAQAQEGHERALALLGELRDGRLSVVPAATPAQSLASTVSLYLPGQAPRAGNVRRTRRDTLDLL